MTIGYARYGGSQQARNLPYERLRGQIGRLSQYTGQAQQFQRGVAGAYQAPSGYGEIERPQIEAIKGLLGSGVQPRERAEALRSVTGTFGSRVGAYATKGARGRGFVSASGIGQYATGAPSAELARGLATAELGLTREAGRRREAGLRAAGDVQEDIRRPREAFGRLVGGQAAGYQVPRRSRRRGLAYYRTNIFT